MENDSKRAPVPLDQYDRRILAELQRNGRISYSELAERIGLSRTPCFRRVRRLEKAGVIRAVVAVLNPASVGLNVTALVQVSLDRHSRSRIELFEGLVRQRPEIVECLAVTGEPADYVLIVIAPNMNHLQRFLDDHIHDIEGVTGVRASVVTREITRKTELPLPQVGDE